MFKNFNSKIEFRKSGWNQFIHEIEKSLLTKHLTNYHLVPEPYLEIMLRMFWIKVMNQLDDKTTVKFMMRAQIMEENRIRLITLSKLQIFNKTNFNTLLKILVGAVALRGDEYDEKEIVKFFFSYQINKDKNIKSLFTPTKAIEQGIHSKFGTYKLPTNADPLLWGDKILHNTKTKIIVSDSNFTYVVNIKTRKRIVDVLKDNVTILTFTDIFTKDSKTYLRRFDKHIYHITVNDGRIILKSADIKTNFMKRSEAEKTKIFKAITFDIETFENNGKLTPYLISFFDGEKAWSYSLENFNNSDEMITAGIQSIMKRTYNGFSVYAHNFSKFDGVFILRILSELGEVTPVINQGQFVKTTLTWFPNDKSKKPYKLIFKDSILLLKASLSSLSKSFNVEEKDIFPILFPNDTNLDYSGEVPEHKFFIKLSHDQYEEYKASFQGINKWNFLREYSKIN